MGKIAFTQAEKDQILSQATQFWDRSTQSMQSLFTLCTEYERLVRLLLPSDLEAIYQQYPDRSALVPPDIFNNINSHLANLRKSLFGKKPYQHLYLAGHPGVRDDRTKKAEQILQSSYDQAGDGTGFPAECDEVHYQALYNGITCCFTQWHQEYRKVLVRQEQTLEPVLDENGDFRYNYEVVAEYPETIWCDIRRVRIPQSSAERKDIRLVGVQSIKQYSDLLELNRRESNHYEFEERKLRDSTFQRDKYFEYVKDESDKFSDQANDQDQFSDKPIEVWSIRGLFRLIQPDGSWVFRDLIVEVGNRTILMACKKNDLPIEGWNLFEFPSIWVKHGRMAPMGLVEAVQDLFVEQFIKRNQSMDSTNRGIYMTWVGDSSACSSLPKYIESNNDQLLLVDTAASGMTNVGAALAPLIRPNLGVDPFQHSQFLSRELQQTMRLSDYLQGNNPETTESATGVVNLIAGGANLTDFMVEKLADTFYRPVAIKHLILWNFFNAQREHTIVGVDGKIYNIAPGEIDIPFHAAVEVSTASTNQAMVRRFIESLPLMLNDPYLNQRVVREDWVEMLELPNRERLLPPDDLLKIQVDRENLALGSGIEQPVHPQDNHSLHIEGHLEYRDYILQEPPERASAAGLRKDVLEQHIVEHQSYMEQMNQALGNTKEMGGGSGNLNQPEGASMKGSAGGKTGAYLAREGRA